MTATVYVVHAVDVEGPMTETIDATFSRMYDDGLPRDFRPDAQTLKNIQSKNIDNLDDDLLDILSAKYSEHLATYMNNWSEINHNIRKATSSRFRSFYKDDFQKPYLYSWFIYDHHDDFKLNPRMHEVGDSLIFDHYLNHILHTDSCKNDGIYFHYHQSAISGNALESATSWTTSTAYDRLIAKRIIDYGSYTDCFRAGLHIERNDLSHWLEMYIPFDLSCRSGFDYYSGSDFDWRNSPTSWRGWHPDWYDYRKAGTMKRHMFRCTDLYTYLHKLTTEEVEEAFTEALSTGSSLLVYYNHDYRDMSFEVEHAYSVLKSTSRQYPDVKFKYLTASLAASELHKLKRQQNKSISIELIDGKFWFKTNYEIFGPQPFLAVKQHNQYYRDNCTKEDSNLWCFAPPDLSTVESIGVAACSPNGGYAIATTKLWNL